MNEMISLRMLEGIGVALFVLAGTVTLAQEKPAVEGNVWLLPKPVTTGGKPLMDALRERKSTREYSPKKLPDQVLSNLLWAAWGMNRADGKRTAPSGMNMQEIDVYVATGKGLWLFDAKEHALKAVLGDDLRVLTGTQPFVKDAPINLIFVADFSKMGNPPTDIKNIMATADASFISENVYLFCASEGLGTVVRGMVDKPTLAKAMKLRANQSITLTQTVGYPKE